MYAKAQNIHMQTVLSVTTLTSSNMQIVLIVQAALSAQTTSQSTVRDRKSATSAIVRNSPLVVLGVSRANACRNLRFLKRRTLHTETTLTSAVPSLLNLPALQPINPSATAPQTQVPGRRLETVDQGQERRHYTQAGEHDGPGDEACWFVVTRFIVFR